MINLDPVFEQYDNLKEDVIAGLVKISQPNPIKDLHLYIKIKDETTLIQEIHPEFLVNDKKERSVFFPTLTS